MTLMLVLSKSYSLCRLPRPRESRVATQTYNDNQTYTMTYTSELLRSFPRALNPDGLTLCLCYTTLFVLTDAVQFDTPVVCSSQVRRARQRRQLARGVESPRRRVTNSAVPRIARCAAALFRRLDANGWPSRPTSTDSDSDPLDEPPSSSSSSSSPSSPPSAEGRLAASARPKSGAVALLDASLGRADGCAPPRCIVTAP